MLPDIEHDLSELQQILQKERERLQRQQQDQ